MFEAVTTLAYLEPGSGSIIVQTLIAMLFSVGYFLRRWIGACFAVLMRPLRRLRGERPVSESGDGAGPTT